MPLIDQQPSPLMRSDWLRIFGVPLLFLLASATSLSIDIRVATFFKQEQHPKLLGEMLDAAEPFGHAFGVIAILVAVYLLDPKKRSRLHWLLGGSLGTGVLTSTAKLLLARTRPRAFDLPSGDVWETFVGWLPTARSSSIQSFPSSHTATAVGLAVMLSAWYPRGRRLFVTLAILVGLQRQHCLAHFPSDVFAGAALGWFVGSCCILGDRRWSRGETHAHAASG